ncbi:MAG: hypothetical protein CML23_06860 [Rhizobiaceae bacterium]|nr:hypothetical protein [Rhizobiaceae bacterium]|tara:strand:- start:185 stop:1510 length:1326 start_codon:yes stop_codon:yes gene_type:complete
MMIKTKSVGMRHFREVAIGAASAFLLRGAGAGLAFLLNVVIARLLGAHGAGLYFMSLSTVIILSVVARMGVDVSSLRHISRAMVNQRWSEIVGYQRWSMWLVTSSSSVLAITVAVAAPLIAVHVFGEPELAVPLAIMSLATVSFSLLTLISENLKAAKRLKPAMLVSSVLYPFAALILIWPMTRQFGVSGANITYVVSTALVAAFGIITWNRTPEFSGVTPLRPDLRQLFKTAMPIWALTFVQQAIIPWAPLQILGMLGTPSDVGVFGAATRVSMLILFFLVAMDSAIIPKFAEFIERDDMESLQRVGQNATTMTAFLAVPVMLTFILGGGAIMSVFGPEFARGGTALAILAVGQAVNLVTGSVGYLLIIKGHESVVRNCAIIGGCVTVGLSFALIPSLGIAGAATASALSIAVSNICLTIQLWRKMRIVILPNLRSFKHR